MGTIKWWNWASQRIMPLKCNVWWIIPKYCFHNNSVTQQPPFLCTQTHTISPICVFWHMQINHYLHGQQAWSLKCQVFKHEEKQRATWGIASLSTYNQSYSKCSTLALEGQPLECPFQLQPYTMWYGIYRASLRPGPCWGILWEVLNTFLLMLCIMEHTGPEMEV